VPCRRLSLSRLPSRPSFFTQLAEPSNSETWLERASSPPPRYDPSILQSYEESRAEVSTLSLPTSNGFGADRETVPVSICLWLRRQVQCLHNTTDREHLGNTCTSPADRRLAFPRSQRRDASDFLHCLDPRPDQQARIHHSQNVLSQPIPVHA
jgi:hypothetical protein